MGLCGPNIVIAMSDSLDCVEFVANHFIMVGGRDLIDCTNSYCE